MGLTISNISAVLKKVIHPVVESQLRKESIFFNQIKKNANVTVVNNQIYIAARTGRHSGIYAVAEGSEPRSGQAKYQQPYTDVKYCFGTLEITDQAIEAAANGDVKAIAAILSTEIESLKDDFKMELNRIMHGDGTGTLCLASGSGSAATGLVVKSNPAGLDPTEYLTEGGYIQIGTGAEVQIKSVDSATGVTLATTATWADGAKITRTGAAEPMGLAGIIDDGTGVATIQNIARSTNPWAKSWVDDSSAVLTEAMMVPQYLKTLRLGGAKVIFANETLFSKYGALLLTYKKSADLKEVLTGGWKGLDFMGGNVGVILDPDTWDTYMQMVNFDALRIAEMSKPFDWLQADAHGGILKRSSSNRTIWEGTMKYYYNLVALNFRSMARLKNKTAS